MWVRGSIKCSTRVFNVLALILSFPPFLFSWLKMIFSISWWLVGSKEILLLLIVGSFISPFFGGLILSLSFFPMLQKNLFKCSAIFWETEIFLLLFIILLMLLFVLRFFPFFLFILCFIYNILQDIRIFLIFFSFSSIIRISFP